jgi:hypothetical protein
MEKNKTGKYFKYAIGEIILVVIGILIALQINGWNEDRKSTNAEVKALKELLIEFKINHKDFMRVYEIKKQALDSVHSYLDFIMDKRIPESKKDFLFNKLGRNTWDPNYSVLNGLFNSGMIGNLKNDSLKSYLSYWHGHVNNYMRVQEAYNEIVTKYVDFRSTVPRNRETLGENSIHSLEKVKLSSKEIVKSIKYQNLVGTLGANLRVQLRGMNQVLENYVKIKALLED